MACPHNPETVLMLDKAATWQRFKERKNELKRQHFAAGGTKRNSPLKGSKVHTWRATLSIYLERFNIKKRYPQDKQPRITTSYYRLAGSADGSGRTMARHVEGLIELGVFRGTQRLQRGIQILLDPSLIVWADTPVKWHPRPQNSAAAGGSGRVSASAAAAGSSAPPDAPGPVDEGTEVFHIMAELRERFAQNEARHANSQLAENQR